MKEIKDANKWREVPYSFTGILNREKMSFLPKLIYQFNEILTKIVREHSIDIDKIILKFGTSQLVLAEKAMAPHSSTLAWKIPWTEESLVGCSPQGREESDTTERLHFHFSLSRIGEGNGNPLQCSCLENPRDGGACWAAVYRVAQSRTRLKRLSSSSSSSSSSWCQW